MISVCPKCKGSGNVPRTRDEDGPELDLHPNLAHFPKTCDKCGGCGKVTLTSAEVAAAADKSG